MKKYLAVGLLFFSALTVFAQDSEQAAAANPNVDVKQFGDWAVRCIKQAPAAQNTPCEMVQFVIDNDAGRELLRVAVTYVEQVKGYWIQFRVPADIAIVQGTVIDVDGKEMENPIPFTRCLQEVCLAEGALTPELRGLFLRGTKGAFAYLNGVGKTVALPMSFNGFTGAMRAMEPKK